MFSTTLSASKAKESLTITPFWYGDRKDIFAHPFTQDNGVLQERQIWLGLLSIPLW